MNKTIVLTEAQKKAGIEANKRGFIAHLLANGKTEEQATQMYKRASARVEQREKLASAILAARK